MEGGGGWREGEGDDGGRGGDGTALSAHEQGVLK